MEFQENDVLGRQNQHLYLICSLQGTLPQVGVSHLQAMNVKVSGNLEGAFTLISAHEETGVVETKADSRVCWQGLGCRETGGRSLCKRDSSLGRKNLMESSGTTEQIFFFSLSFLVFLYVLHLLQLFSFYYQLFSTIYVFILGIFVHWFISKP